MPDIEPDTEQPDPARPLGDLRPFTRRRKASPRVLLIAILAAAVITFGGAALMAMILAAVANALR